MQNSANTKTFQTLDGATKFRKWLEENYPVSAQTAVTFDDGDRVVVVWRWQ